MRSATSGIWTRRSRGREEKKSMINLQWMVLGLKMDSGDKATLEVEEDEVE